MISRLRLQNWRSYEELDISLVPGTTFVVAPNGVGKTSLVYGLAWAVFGPHSSVDPRSCIRSGTPGSEAQVDLELPSGNHLSITRNIKRQGKPTAMYELDGKKVTEAAARIEMELALGIELEAASNLAMMLGGGHIAASDSLKLESHLHQAFGVAHLLNAAESAEAVAKEVRNARVAIRATNKKLLADRAEIERGIQQLEAKVRDLDQRRIELQNLRGAAAEQMSAIERHDALVLQRRRVEQRRSQIVAAIEAAVGHSMPSKDGGSIREHVNNQLNSIDVSVAELTKRSTASHSMAANSLQAIELLEGEDGACPTCLRPLPADERSSAISVQRSHHEKAKSDAVSFQKAAELKNTHAKSLSQLLAQFDALVDPAIDLIELDVPSRAEAEASFQQANAALDYHNQQFGRAQSELDALRYQVADDYQFEEEQERLRLAFRREAAAIAGAKVLRIAADRTIESRITPIANEVRTRWKHLFTNNGLAFKPDGSITRVQHGQVLDWDTLSGGERTWARIVTHLIVIAATTSLPFAWFDEPLEHLDPQLRHAVAATLAKATRLGSPSQLLVTTYEHGIAQQLADDLDDAQIIAVRETGSVDGSRH